MASRKICTRRHAKKRAKERLGISLTTKLEKQIVQAIRSNKFTFVHRTSRTRIVADVDLAGRIIRVVYSKSTKQIVTVLPRKGVQYEK